MFLNHPLNRRDFLKASAGVAATATLTGAEPESPTTEPIIDIHQHTNYAGRTDEQLVKHQRAMGISKTILLPAGTPVERPSTHMGKSNGLAAKCGGNQSCLELARQHPKEFLFGANEVADLPSGREEIKKYLKLGAIIIAEQKFSVECDSEAIENLARVAQDYGVPVLMHFQHATYNMGIERFHKILAKFPKVNFIGHAQTWWGNIDAKHDQKVMYPTTKVTPGGITDRLLADYPNMYGDMSAGSGLNSMLRDEDHARGFLDRHQDKLLYGSDCNDVIGRGPGCQGAQTLAAIRRLAPNPKAIRKIFYENAARLMKIG
ncbi:MAG: amidohydrolase family protein [Verrucomicrobia bacterium]|nr:amidohydrolase family protein [Verrucomicrobiota bacterium]